MLTVTVLSKSYIHCHLTVVNFKTCDTETDSDRHNLYSFNHDFVLKFVLYLIRTKDVLYVNEILYQKHFNKTKDSRVTWGCFVLKDKGLYNNFEDQAMDAVHVALFVSQESSKRTLD